VQRRRAADRGWLRQRGARARRSSRCQHSRWLLGQRCWGRRGLRGPRDCGRGRPGRAPHFARLTAGGVCGKALVRGAGERPFCTGHTTNVTPWCRLGRPKQHDTRE
jgi:hypothetical protein